MGNIDPELLKRIDLLASKLNVGAQYIWATLIHQAFIEGMMDLAVCLVWGFIVPLIWWGFWLYFNRNYREGKDGTYNYDTRQQEGAVKGRYSWLYDKDLPGAYFFFIGGAILHIVALITFCDYLTPALTELYNPGFYALQTLGKAL